MERQWELQLMPGPKQDEDEDPVPVDNTEQFHSRDSLQLSIGFYKPQKENEAKVDVAKQLHPINMDENQMGKEGLGQVTLSLGSGIASSEAAMASYENQIRQEKEEEGEEKEKMNEDGGAAELVKEQAREQLRLATVEKAYAEHARELANRQMELAKAEFASAKRIREQAQAELNRAQLLKEQATRRIDATCMEITCQACRQQFQYRLSWPNQPTPNVADQNRNHPQPFIHANAISDQSTQEESYLSLQLMPQPVQDQQLLLNSSSQMASTSKQQKN